jgi:aminopeptidase N
VQTEFARKFTSSTGTGIYPSATAVTGYVIIGHKEYAGQRTHIYDIMEPYWKSLCRGNAQYNEAA